MAPSYSSSETLSASSPRRRRRVASSLDSDETLLRAGARHGTRGDGRVGALAPRAVVRGGRRVGPPGPGLVAALGVDGGFYDSPMFPAVRLAKFLVRRPISDLALFRTVSDEPTCVAMPQLSGLNTAVHAAAGLNQCHVRLPVQQLASYLVDDQDK